MRKPKPNSTDNHYPALRLVPGPESKPLMTPEQEAELKRLIEAINGPYLKEQKERRRRRQSGEDPDLPPVA